MKSDASASSLLAAPEAGRTPITSPPAVTDGPWQARKNRLASVAGKQDDFVVHHATAANGKPEVFVAQALQAGVGAKAEAVSPLRNHDPFLWQLLCLGSVGSGERRHPFLTGLLCLSRGSFPSP
jgi:hypothetical protein